MTDATAGAGQIGVVTNRKARLGERTNLSQAEKAIESVSARWSLQKPASVVGDGIEEFERKAFWR